MATMTPSAKWQRCDTKLRLGGCADDAPSPYARENKKVATAWTYDGDRLLQHLVAVSGRGYDVTDTEVQANAIIRMARRAAGARPSDRGSERRRRSLRWFLQRRREARSCGRSGASSSPSSPCS